MTSTFVSGNSGDPGVLNFSFNSSHHRIHISQGRQSQTRGQATMMSWRIVRYPVVFGGCLLAYFGAFSFRKTYFKDEVEETRDKNKIRAEKEQIQFETTRHQVRTELNMKKG